MISLLYKKANYSIYLSLHLLSNVSERYRTIVASFYRGANGILLVFDVTDPNTFLSCKRKFSSLFFI